LNSEDFLKELIVIEF